MPPEENEPLPMMPVLCFGLNLFTEYAGAFHPSFQKRGAVFADVLCMHMN